MRDNLSVYDMDCMISLLAVLCNHHDPLYCDEV